MPPMRSRFLLIGILGLAVLCLLSVLAYFLPPVHDRLAWRVESFITQVRYTLNPPEQAVFLPQGAPVALDDEAARATMESIVQATLLALPTQTPSPAEGGVQEGGAPSDAPSPTPSPIPSPTATFAPPPPQVSLTGYVFEYQKFNNCGPANLSMALSFWGWQGDQRDTRAYLRPYAGDRASDGVDDKNVNPEEMVQFVEQKTDLKALMRFAGEAETLKRLLAAGFPVITERGHDPADDDWMGHYVLFTGYDDARARYTVQDSLIMENFPLPYEELVLRWMDFNYMYIVIYPPEREAEVLSLLGPHADPAYNLQVAVQRAQQDISALSGRDQFFAWYNLGSSLVKLEDWEAAAQAYDQAFSLYAGMSEEERPWRMLWYQAGPYAAYYYTGRYNDAINLADTTLSIFSRPILEEALYWRGLAKEALGDREGALADLERAYELNPYSTPAGEALGRLAGD